MPVVYGDRPETKLHLAPRANSRVTNHVLMGTWLSVIESQDDWLRVETRRAGPGGWVRSGDVRTEPILKMFFVDVGQGDGAIVESPEGIMMIDGGPNSNFSRFVRHRYRPLLNEGTVHIRSLVVSHPDLDHYFGLTSLLRDRRFTFGTIFHNGIARYYESDARPFDLGTIRRRTINGADFDVLVDTFSTLNQARQIVQADGVQTRFRQFWEAALEAEDQGRLTRAARITARDTHLPGYSSGDASRLTVEVIGPVPTTAGGRVEYVAFPDPHDGRDGDASSSHTRNGHSLVLRLRFGDHSILMGGDLNIPAQKHLMDYYGDDNPFRSDVAKACHHGSSDFSVDFLKRVRPYVNVFSSGDNKSFDHPTADAVGAAARHARGDRPLFFSTELARAESRSGTHYGLINLRSNGDDLVMAQMKEQHSRADVWDSFVVPNRGKFPDWE